MGSEVDDGNENENERMKINLIAAILWHLPKELICINKLQSTSVVPIRRLFWFFPHSLPRQGLVITLSEAKIRQTQALIYTLFFIDNSRHVLELLCAINFQSLTIFI